MAESIFFYRPWVKTQELTIVGSSLTAAITVGASGVPAGDFVWYGTTAGHLVRFDVDGDTNGSILIGANTKGLMFNLYGDVTGCGVFWDPSGDTNGALSIGATGGSKGVDLTAYGDTNGAYLTWDQSADALLLVGDSRVDFSSCTVAAANTDGGLIRAGTSETPLVEDTPDMKFISLYFDNGAGSGDNRGIYNRLYLSGAGGGGESLRSYTEIVGVAAGTAHGAHISLGMGESTTVGAVTGLGVAVRSTLGIPNDALPSGGTYSALMSEIYSFGDNSDVGAVNELSFLRVVNDGTTGGKGTVDDKAYLVVLDGFADNAAHMWYVHAPTTLVEAIRVKTPGGIRYIGLYSTP